MPWAGSHSWSWWVGFSVCLRFQSRGAPYCDTVWSSLFPCYFRLKFFIFKENWSFPEAHGSQCQGPRGRLRSNGPSRAKQGQAGSRAFRRRRWLPRCGRWWQVEVPPWSTPTPWRCAHRRAKIRRLKTGNQNGFTWPGLWLGQRVGQLRRIFRSTQYRGWENHMISKGTVGANKNRFQSELVRPMIMGCRFSLCDRRRLPMPRPSCPWCADTSTQRANFWSLVEDGLFPSKFFDTLRLGFFREELPTLQMWQPPSLGWSRQKLQTSI